MSHASTYEFLSAITCQLHEGRTPAEVLGNLATGDREKVQASACARRAAALATSKQTARVDCPDDGA